MKRKGSKGGAGTPQKKHGKAEKCKISPVPGQSINMILDHVPVEGSLHLADGTQINGYSFGANVPVSGEVVFNTGMVGYPEALTDPSYAGQILVLTFPLIGNYGVPDMNEKDVHGLPKNFESEKIHIKGLIVADYSQQHSHWNAKSSLGEWLTQHNVPAIYGVDTRMLTKKIREHGVILGKIDINGKSVGIEDPNKLNLVAEVSTKEVRVFNKGKGPRIIAFDCGMKYNIIRYLAEQEMEIMVVPYDYDLKESGVEFDGLFVSNGPGDPTMAQATIDTLKWAIALEKPKPIFGICLGNQLLALAAGGSTYKMKYGNRGMNQPCIDMRTTRCYITPQNHGYAVDGKSLPTDWTTFFVNANDGSNEGVIHSFKPFFGVQFHPEACGGPMDTGFLFNEFFEKVRGAPPKVTVLDYAAYQKKTYKKVLLLGSGGLSIGQAGEFDYSGSQAIKALKEEGIEVILVNPNIATVQTSKGMANSVYFLPVDAETVTKVIEKERPDGILVSMGGQTALNVGMQLFDAGIFEKYNLDVLGTPIPVIDKTEDREKFAACLEEIGESAALSYSAHTMGEALEAAEKIGYPVLVRAAFALGGLGSGFAANPEELEPLARKAFSCSSQLLIDQDLRGWKEIEYEVVRDCMDNCITVCNMENFDPLGIHTGDSIVVCPSQTLSNREYFKLRSTAQKVVRHLGVVGECNIQYAMDPKSERYCIIEVNARLSRSSALASKATGYPLAYIAAKLALGEDLAKIKNSVTKTTTACFEPSLDYCVVKMPRWDLKKFERVSCVLGSCMLSVGEVMAIGRNFEETIQKAVRMVNPDLDGLQACAAVTAVEDSISCTEDLDKLLRLPTDQRLFAVCAALDAGYSIDRLYDLTRIDRWYLNKLHHISKMWSALKTKTWEALSPQQLKLLKCNGFSDSQIARGINSSELHVRRKRILHGITPWVKQIDTLAAEFPAQTNYLYMTYNAAEHDIEFNDNGVMVLGCGAYCIGSSVEFDWCAVSAIQTIRRTGHQAIVVNYNPETVSTDYDESDKLYFEELSFERVLDIYELETAAGIVVSVGGQIPNNLALPLYGQGVNILGTSPESIDQCEDRNRFSAMCDRLGVRQPPWREVKTTTQAAKFANDVGYPVLLRPSYVLSGAAMKVAINETQLEQYLNEAIDVSSTKAIVVSKFIMNAKEIEFDGVANNGEILNYAMSEHVENAGVHSGDATLVLPAQKLYVETFRQVKRIASRIAKELNITGPFNVQLMARDNDVQVIECNLRASRTFPFISKTFDFNFIELATKAMMGLPVKPHPIALVDIDYVGVKVAQFSFTRLQGADPTLGVEMSSTGEVACYGQDLHDAYLKALQATGFKLPNLQTRRNILLSIGSDNCKREFMESMQILSKMGYALFATPGTADFYTKRGISGITVLQKPGSKLTPNVKEYLQAGKIDCVINISSLDVAPKEGGDDEVTAGYVIRRTAVDFGLSMLTNIKTAVLFCAALERYQGIKVQTIQEMYDMAVMGWTSEGTASKLQMGGKRLRTRSQVED
jgi:carbamoyl-phosphate synthase/aspartate carbamoyltransferase